MCIWYSTIIIIVRRVPVFIVYSSYSLKSLFALTLRYLNSEVRHGTAKVPIWYLWYLNGIIPFPYTEYLQITSRLHAYAREGKYPGNASGHGHEVCLRVIIMSTDGGCPACTFSRDEFTTENLLKEYYRRMAQTLVPLLCNNISTFVQTKEYNLTAVVQNVSVDRHRLRPKHIILLSCWCCARGDNMSNGYDLTKLFLKLQSVKPCNL